MENGVMENFHCPFCKRLVIVFAKYLNVLNIMCPFCGEYLCGTWHLDQK